jgi:hypothetical protein
MSYENPNKYIIEKFIADAVALLEQEGETLTSLLENMLVDAIYQLTNSEGVKFIYKKVIDSLNNYYILAKSDLMQEYHVLPDV